MHTRDKIMEVALRLFGEQGFAGTSVAQIEREAGLAPGAGGLFRHFRSKRELLTTAVESRLSQRSEWEQVLDTDVPIAELMDSMAPGASLVDRILLMCRMGLARLEHNRDVSRILMRDNSVDPAVLASFRHDEYDIVMKAITRGLTELSGGSEHDWEAAAAVLVGAVSHYWMLADTFDGDHPSGVDTERYLRATAELVAAQLTRASNDPGVGTEPTISQEQ